jgi:hypothetical protein
MKGLVAEIDLEMLRKGIKERRGLGRDSGRWYGHDNTSRLESTTQTGAAEEEYGTFYLSWSHGSGWREREREIKKTHSMSMNIMDIDGYGAVIEISYLCTVERGYGTVEMDFDINIQKLKKEYSICKWWEEGFGYSQCEIFFRYEESIEVVTLWRAMLDMCWGNCLLATYLWDGCPFWWV